MDVQRRTAFVRTGSYPLFLLERVYFRDTDIHPLYLRRHDSICKFSFGYRCQRKFKIFNAPIFCAANRKYLFQFGFVLSVQPVRNSNGWPCCGNTDDFGCVCFYFVQKNVNDISNADKSIFTDQIDARIFRGTHACRRRFCFGKARFEMRKCFMVDGFYPLMLVVLFDNRVVECQTV